MTLLRLLATLGTDVQPVNAGRLPVRNRRSYCHKTDMRRTQFERIAALSTVVATQSKDLREVNIPDLL
jgi:hypothetical protein